MSQENKNIDSQIIFNNNIFRFTVYGIIIGFIFPLLSWSLDILINDIKLSLDNIWEMHIDTPIHFIVDLAPLVLGIIFYIFLKRRKRITDNLEFIIKERNKLISRNSEYAKKIGEGDFSVQIEVNEEDIIGTSLLLMRNNLVATYQKENEQSWIAKGKEIIGDILRHNNNLYNLAYETITSLVNYTNSVQGAFYIYEEEKNILINIATFAFNRKKYINQEFKIGQGLVGQAAYERDIIYRKEIPNDYVTISSGIIGDKKPKTILISPLIGDDKLQGVIEFASLSTDLPDRTLKLIKETSEIIAQTVFNLKVNTRTEKLLQDSQEMTKKLQKNEDELRRNAQEMKLTQKEIEETNRKLAAQIQEVERGQKRLYALLENASEVISIYDKDGSISYESPSIKHILGYDPVELIGKNGFEVFDDAANRKLKAAFDKLLENPNEPITFEYQFTKSDDEIMWLETTGRNLLKSSAIQGIIFNTRDITVRKVAEKAQRMSGEMQALSENSPDMIVRLSPDGKFFYVNPVVEKFTGVNKNVIIKRSLDDVEIDPEIISFFQDSLKKVISTKQKFETETIFPRIDIDEERIVQFNAIPEYNKENELETILFVAHDITEQKQIQLEIEEKNKSITESINYAQRIQSAIIPNIESISEHLPKSFVMYIPRDVVSGDLPWFLKNGDDIYIAAIDCTGHGVPGALLSFIAYFILNSIVTVEENIDAGTILDLLHNGVRKTLKQDTPDAEARDGMDIALCKINFIKKELHFSGAHRPLYFLSEKGEFLQFKGTPQAIGGIPTRKGKEKNFENHLINFNLGDKIFFFSDGLPDQIGGEDGRKYKNQRIRDMITENISYNMEEHKNFFMKDLKEFMGNNKQIDDVLFIGIEF
jgi:PAS domain S-box-containing protein